MRLLALAVSGALVGGLAGGLAVASGAQTSAASPLKVGLVTDIGGLNDRSFNFLANKGLQQAAKTLGIKATVLQSSSAADYIPNITRLAAQGNQLIITNGFLMGAATGQMAKKFPNVKFAIIDLSASDKSIGGASNVRGLIFKEQEPGYLAGYLAGLFEKTKGPRLNGKQTIGSVGGQKIPPVDHYIAGFQAGAKAADPGIKTLNGYSQDFVAPAKCKEQALAQISQGSDIEFQVAGQCGLGTLSAAQDKKVWGIGVDADQAYLGPQILTSAMKRVDTSVFDTIRDTKAGKFTGGKDVIFDLKNKGVALGKISPLVPKSIVAKVRVAQAKIIAGRIKIPNTVP
jgi:basic membrane protein A